MAKKSEPPPTIKSEKFNDIKQKINCAPAVFHGEGAPPFRGYDHRLTTAEKSELEESIKKFQIKRGYYGL